jgi:hypothetical protein
MVSYLNLCGKMRQNLFCLRQDAPKFVLISCVTATIEFFCNFDSADCHLNPAWVPLVLIRLVCCLFFSQLMANHFYWKSYGEPVW